jgi:RHS repeat-associated protein
LDGLDPAAPDGAREAVVRHGGIRTVNRIDRYVVVPLCAVLVATMAGAPPAVAGDPDRASWTDQQRRDHGRSLWPDRAKTPPVSTRRMPASKPTAPSLRTAAPDPVVWPSAGAADIDLPAADTLALHKRTPEGSATPGGLPVHIRTAGEPVSTAGEARVRVEVFDRDTTATAGVRGVLLRVRDMAGTAAGRVELNLDYSGFAGGLGGDWASRLRLVRLPACVLTQPTGECRQGTVLPARNNLTAGTLTATVDLARPDARLLMRTAGQTATVAGPAVGGVVLALAAAPSGPSGDWSATPLSASATWQVAAQTGDFTWSYPLRVPPAPGGPAPQLALGYSSGSVDGRVASTNNQTSWIGDGFDMWPGYVERSYVSCADDTTGGNNAGHTTGDLCWKTDNASLVLGGQASELVRDNATGTWRLRSDDGSRVQRLTGGTNADNDTEYWKLTKTDGTQYFFGVGKRYAADTDRTDSVWTAPVFGNHSNEPCHQSTFAASHCRQAWRWNLDYVIDPRQNTVTYYYTPETNNYGRDLNTAVSSYDRGGWLSRVDYGERAGTEHTTSAPGQIVFDVSERCLANCSSLTEATAANWPDVPYDQICSSSTSCPDVVSPAFFTRKRLTTVTTNAWIGGTRANVDRWTMTHTFPDPGDGQSNPVLWLDSIQHTGLRPGSSSITLPKVVFHGIQLANRVDAAGDLGPAMIRYRISSIDSEAGGVTSVNYAPADCTPTSLPSAPDSNTRRCFPVYWNPEGNPDPVLEYFHKYVVASVVAEPRTSTDPPVETYYSYLGGAAWHYDDNELVKAKYRTWGQFRGFGNVEMVTGAVGTPARTKIGYLFLRGMHGDKLSGGGTRSVTITDSQGGTITDHERYSGFTREQITYNGAAEVTGNIATPWLSPPTATAADGTKAYLLGTAQVDSRVAAPAVPGGVRRTRTVTTFDSLGFATTVDDQGDTSTPLDDLCTRTEYARNPALHIMGTTVRTETVSVACGANPQRPSHVVSDERQYYDGATSFANQVPTRGLVTAAEQVVAYTGSTANYKPVSRTVHDTQGRVTEAYDGMNRKTTTVYTPATGGPLTRTVVTTPDPDGAGPLTAHGTTSDLDPAWGVPTKFTDPNGKLTEATYDALGRRIKVWLPGRSKATDTPNMEYAYLIRTDGPSTVTTKSLIHNATYLTSIDLYDGLMRARQTQSPSVDRTSPGRVVTDTLHDSRGNVVTRNDAWYTTGAVSNDLAIPTTTVPGRTRLEYDGVGRPTVEIFDVNGVERRRTTTSYGGDRVDVDPPVGGVPTTTVSDARGHTTEIRQYTGGSPTGSYQTTRYTYYPSGRVSGVTDPAGNNWGYGYDLAGRQTSATDPDRGQTTSTYDNSSRLTSTTDGRNVTLAYVYDQMGRKIEVRETSLTGTLRAKWTYDTIAKGHLTSSTRYAGAAEYVNAVTGYDDGYRPLGQSVTLPSTGVPTGEAAIAGTYTTNYTYTLNGQPKTLKHPATANLGTETVTTFYDAVGAAEWMGGGFGWGVYVAGTLYTPFAEPLLLDLGNTYSQMLNLSYETGTRRLDKAWLVREGVSGYDMDVTYGYDDVGNVMSIVDRPTGKPVDAQCFRYTDGLRRLTETWTPASANCGTNPSVAGLGGPAPYWTTFGYDQLGNRTSETRHASAGDTVRTYTYPTPGGVRPHALTQVAETGPGGSKTYRYSYDNGGNTTCRPITTATNTCTPTPGTGSQSLAWDNEGRLTSVTPTGGSTSSYLYDADGGRLLRRESGVTTVYLPGGQELRLTTATGAKAAQRYYTFGGRTVAVRTAPGLAGVSTLIADHHGTAELSIANTTNVLTQRRHDPFGKPRGSTPSWPSDHGYLDKPKDVTGLTHIDAREYDPVLGRFVSVDPIMDLTDPQQWHGYAYGNNNPATISDPTGEWGLDGLFDMIMSAIAAVVLQIAYQQNLKSKLLRPPKISTGGGSGSTWKPGGGGSGGDIGVDLTDQTGSLFGNPGTSRSDTGLLTGFCQIGGPIIIACPGTSIGKPGQPFAPGDSGGTGALGGGTIGGKGGGPGPFGGTRTLDDRWSLALAMLAAFAMEKLTSPVTNDEGERLVYVTYTKRNPKNGKVYSGYTSGYGTPDEVVARRDQGHHMTKQGFTGRAVRDEFAYATEEFEKRYLDPAFWAIRGREQQLIDHYGGAQRDKGTSGNVKRGYAKLNPLGPLFHLSSDFYFGPYEPYTGY